MSTSLKRPREEKLPNPATGLAESQAYMARGFMMTSSSSSEDSGPECEESEDLESMYPALQTAFITFEGQKINGRPVMQSLAIDFKYACSNHFALYPERWIRINVEGYITTCDPLPEPTEGHWKMEDSKETWVVASIIDLEIDVVGMVTPCEDKRGPANDVATLLLRNYIHLPSGKRWPLFNDIFLRKHPEEVEGCEVTVGPKSTLHIHGSECPGWRKCPAYHEYLEIISR